MQGDYSGYTGFDDEDEEGDEDPSCDDELTVANRREQLLQPFEMPTVSCQFLINYSYFVADTAPVGSYSGHLRHMIEQEASWQVGNAHIGDVALYLAPLLFVSAPASLVRCGRADMGCFSSDDHVFLRWVGDTITWTSKYSMPTTFPAAALIYALRHLGHRFHDVAALCWPADRDQYLAPLKQSLEELDRVLFCGELSMLRRSATAICIGLAELELPALVTLEILDAAFPNTIRMAAKWDLIVAVKNRASKR